MRFRRTALLAVATASLIGCSDEGQQAESTVVATTGAVDISRRVAELERFEPDPGKSGEQCGDLSVSNGTVQISAAGMALVAAPQTNTSLSQSEIRLEVRFGKGLPSFTCTDLDSEERLAVIDETWPATAANGSFTVVPGAGCSIATLELVDVVAEAPTGQQVALGDFTLTNKAWQLWPPSECHLSDAPP